jgi:hypothetical protein
MRLRFTYVALVGLAFFLGGCASTPPQQPLAMQPASLKAEAGRIGVAMSNVPKVDTEFPGAGCLLCLAAASAMNSSLTDHVRTLPPEDVPALKDRAAALIKAKGGMPVLLGSPLDVKTLPDFKSETPNAARKDFRGLKDKHQVDKLLMIQLDTIGVVRNYSAYVPNGEPKAVFSGTAYMVDLKSNALEWYHPFSITKAADGDWDQAPKFPRMTNAFYQALELGKDEILRPLQ